MFSRNHSYRLAPCFPPKYEPTPRIVLPAMCFPSNPTSRMEGGAANDDEIKSCCIWHAHKQYVKFAVASNSACWRDLRAIVLVTSQVVRQKTRRYYKVLKNRLKYLGDQKLLPRSNASFRMLGMTRGLRRRLHRAFHGTFKGPFVGSFVGTNRHPNRKNGMEKKRAVRCYSTPKKS